MPPCLGRAGRRECFVAGHSLTLVVSTGATVGYFQATHDGQPISKCTAVGHIGVFSSARPGAASGATGWTRRDLAFARGLCQAVSPSSLTFCLLIPGFHPKLSPLNTHFYHQPTLFHINPALSSHPSPLKGHTSDFSTSKKCHFASLASHPVRIRALYLLFPTRLAHPPDSTPSDPSWTEKPPPRPRLHPTQSTKLAQLQLVGLEYSFRDIFSRNQQDNNPSLTRTKALFMYQHDHNSVLRHSPIKLRFFRIAERSCSPQLSSDG